jgi:5,5'-dehydrodivanillate O-demethylase
VTGTGTGATSVPAAHVGRQVHWSSQEDEGGTMSIRITDEDLVYTGPDSIAGKYMRRFWHPVMRAEDLKVGQAKPVRIMSEDFTLYRGHSGAPHAVGNRCAHRHVQLSTGTVEEDCIRCLYHGWKFDAEGVCVELPGGRARGRTKVIPSYPTQEYLGLVFVYLGEGEAPPLPRYPKLEQPGVLDVTLDTFPCNYYCSLENDAFHLPFTHKDLMEGRGLTGFPEVWGEETDWGIACYERWPNRNSVGVNHKGMPNVGYIVPAAIIAAKGTKHALHVSWRVPIDDNNHMQIRANLTTVTGKDAEDLLASRTPAFYDRSDIGKLGDLVLAGKLDLQTIKHPHIEAIQDYVAQVGMGPVELRKTEHLAKSDATTIILRNVWKRELEALANGGELKDWQMTASVQEPVPMI